jgi:GGDEF domain-containing protein
MDYGGGHDSGMDALHIVAILLTLAAEPTDQVAGLAYNENFVVIATNQSLADEVLQKADTLRKKIALDWIGEELPAGVSRASLQVRLSASSEDGETWSLGHSSDRHHHIWITTSREKVATILSHEIAHLVLAAHIHETLPAWADEAVACLQEDQDSINKRERLIEQMARTSSWVQLPNLLDSKSLTDRNKYSAALSVTQFLLERKDKATFISFSRAGRVEGWNTALSRYYRIRSVLELQNLWQEWASDRTRRKLAAINSTVNRPNESLGPNPARPDPNAKGRRPGS